MMPSFCLIFCNTEIFEECGPVFFFGGGPVILQNVPQFELVGCFLMIKFGIHIPGQNISWVVRLHILRRSMSFLQWREFFKLLFILGAAPYGMRDLSSSTRD